jgi:(S)-sulfolactate dehydrogenase
VQSPAPVLALVASWCIMAIIVISEWIDAAAAERLAELHHVVMDAELYADRPRLLRALADADAWIVRNQTRVDLEAIAAAPRLKVVGRVGVGLETIDVGALRARDVVVSWAPGTNAGSVAEYVMGAMLAHARRYAEATAHLSSGGWDRQRFMGTELHGKVLGIVGLGDIGARLARRARAFGMSVLASDPFVHEHVAAVQEYEVRLVELGELLATSDVVSLHAPLVASTRGLIGAAALSRMKPTALLVNTSRGGLVDEEALAAALQRGALGGAALDVRAHEPPGADDPLRGAPNLILTPHVAGVTHESNLRASQHIADEVLRVLRGEPARTPVPG